MTQPSPVDEVHALFEQALNEPPSARAAFLDRACAGRPELRERLERLLRRSADEAGFLDRAALRGGEASSADEAADAPGRVVGAYRLTRLLGRGGMAEVWLGERNEGGFRQHAALKLIARASGSLGQRFATERAILAGLAHPRIARLYDGGVEADGTAYMVMEYIEGEHLMAYARARALTLGERLELFLQICDAVAYAHTQLVVHRDLKPSNILVTAAGQATLLDFGIARLLDAQEGAESTRTIYFSPSYAAPEQVTGQAAGTATDVYALGVILFELLTGRLPWPAEAPIATVVQRLMDAPSPAPSRVAGADAPVAARALRGDLDAIVGKALRREPEQRYPDARTLADDIRRHLGHRPVHARSGARSYVARRFVRRNWLPLSTAALLFAAMAVATVAVAWQARKARLAAQRAEAVQGFMVDLFKMNSDRQKDPAKVRQTTVRELLDIGAARIGESLDLAPENKLALLRVFSDLYADGLGEGYPSIPVIRQAVALSRSLHGEDSVELASDRVHLAKQLAEQGERAEARELLQAAAATLDRRGDRTSELRGRLHVAQAYAFLNQDDRRTREEADAAIAVLRRYPPSRELVLALVFRSLAADKDSGVEAAVQSIEEAIRVSRAIDGDRGPMLAVCYMNLASLQKKAWKLDAAEASAREALDLGLKVPGEFAYDRTRAMSNLASIQLAGGRIKEGLESARKAKEWLVAPMGGSNDPAITAGVLQALATALGAAGELDDGLAEAMAAVKALRGTSQDLLLASALSVAADRFADSGRPAEAAAALEEARAIRQRVRGSAGDGDVPRLVRAALDRGDPQHARALLADLGDSGTATKEAMMRSFRRDLLEAETELQGGDAGKSARLALAVGERMRASEMARYLRAPIADGELLAGLAQLRGGDAAAARPLLEGALAARSDLYLPRSPKIAEAELALAECDLAQGRREAAAERVAHAEAIQARHASLSARYTEPLRRLRERLAAPARRAHGPAAAHAAGYRPSAS